MINKIFKITVFFIICIITNMSVNSVNAQAIQKPNIDDLLYKFDAPSIEDPTTTDYIASLPEGDIWVLIGDVTWYLLVIANILAFISFVSAGVYMLISQGNEESISKAKEIFVYTLIAMIIAATALAIVTGITNIQFF